MVAFTTLFRRLAGFSNVAAPATIDNDLEGLLRLPPAPSVAEFTRDVNPVSGSVVGRGISKGILTIGETGSGFLESLSDILGAKGARDFWREKGDSLAELSRNIPVQVESISDIKNLPDVGAYAALSIGQLIPQIVLSVGSGLAARAAAKGLGAVGQLAATVGGAALPSVIQETGGISREIRETSGELRPEIAFPAGLLAGALDTLTPARFLGKVLDTAKDEVKERTWRSLVRQTFKEIPRTAAVEGLTESAQESIAISANKFADSTYDLVNGQNFLRILDAGLQGMIGGGAIGAVTPAIQRAAQREVVDTTPKRKEGQAALPEDDRELVQSLPVAKSEIAWQSTGEIRRNPQTQLYELFSEGAKVATAPTFEELMGRESEMSAGYHISMRQVAPQRFEILTADTMGAEPVHELVPTGKEQRAPQTRQITQSNISERQGALPLVPPQGTEERAAERGGGGVQTRRAEPQAALPAVNPQTQSAPFRAWFGASKVVDDSGQPLVVYKGMYPYDYTQETASSRGPEIKAVGRVSEFPAFNKGEPGIQVAGFFGDKATASRFAVGMQGAVYPVFLSLQNPLVIDGTGRNAGDIQFGESGRPFRDAIRSGKYDGAIIRNTKDEGTIYVALRPEQIKSAISNVGTFDPSTGDIQRSIGLATPVPPTLQTPPTIANTVEELRAKLPQSGLAKEHQSLIAAFLDTKAVKYLEGLQFAIRDALEQGWQGSYLGDLIEIARNSRPDTGPHEFMHRLYDVLPESDQAVIRAARLEDIRAQVSRPMNAFDLDALSEFERREVPATEFVSRRYNREVYHLSSDAEYFAATMAGRFQNRLSAPKDFLSRIKEIVADLWAAIKKAVRLPQTSEQIFRNLMAGRYDVTPIERMPPQASVRPITRRKVLEQVVKTAQVYNPASIPTEAVMATGQTLDFAQQIGNAIQTQVPPEFRTRVGRWLGFNLVDDISNYVAYVLGVVPQNYAQARATLATEGLKNTLALHANRGLEIFETRVQTVKKALARQRDKVLRGPAFAAKMRRWANASVRQQATEAARKSLEASLRSGLAQAVERVREAGANEALFESADAERRFYEGLLDNSRTLTELVQDIAARVALTPNGVSIMDDADAMVQAYLAQLPFDQRPRIDPITRRNERLAMIKVAADLLARNVDLRNLQLAAVWSEQSVLRKPVRTIEDQLVRDLTAGKAPSQAIGPLITKLRNLATDEGRAAAVVAAKYKELLKEFNRLQELEQADAVATNVMESPEYRAFRTTVARDAGAEVRPTEAKDIDIGSPFFTQHTVFLPDGSRVELRMHQDAAGYAETERLSTQAANDLLTWLHDPANADSPYRDYYQRQYDTLKAIWHSSIAQNPPKQLAFFKDIHFKIFDVMLGIFDGLMRNIGTRSVALGRMAANAWKDSVHQFNNWTAVWKFKLIEANVKATRSHPDIWDVNSRGNAVLQWRREVLTPIFASWEDPTRDGLKAGDTIPSTGHVVTAQDMEAVRLQDQAMRAAYAIDITKGREDIISKPVIEDRMVPGAPFLRTPARLSKYFAFRRFNKTGSDIAKAYVELAETPNVTPAQIEAFWNTHWDAVASMVTDRNAQFSTIVPFEPAIAAATPEVTAGNITTIQQLVGFISANGSVTPDDARAFVLAELDKNARAVNRYVKTNEDLNTAKIDTIEDDNPFTTNRGPRIAPSFWYDYGFGDSRSIHNFAASGSSFYFETFLKSLESIKIDLQKVAAQIGAEIDALAKQVGPTRAAQQVAKANEKDIALGDATLRFEKVAQYIAGLDNYTAKLRDVYKPGGKAIVEELSLVNRVLGTFIAGILFSEYTVTRNALEGGFLWNGIRLSKIYGSTLEAFPQAFLQLFINTLKLGFNAVPAVARGATKLHPFRAVATLANTGNILAAEKDLFGDAVMEVANSLFGKNQLYRDLQSAGLALPVYPKEQLGAMAELPFTGGEITAEAYSDVPLLAVAQKMGGGILSFLDAQMALFVRPLSPRIGDLLANMTIGSSTLKGLQNLEGQARKTFAAYQAAGTAVPAGHIFTPNEVLGSWFGGTRTENDLREIELWFNDAGIPLHDSLRAYMERLATQGAAAEWLTPEEKLRLITSAVEASNAATPLNRPLALKKNTLVRVLGALLGWNVNAYRTLINMLSRSASDPNYNAYQLRLAIGMWFLAVLAFSALGQYGIEEVMRFLAKFVRGEERATRLPTEQEGERAAKAWITYAFNTIPLVSTAVNSAFSDMPNRAAFSPNFLIQSKLIDLGNYVAGAVNSRDPTYRLPQLLKGFVPGASVFLNRLPSTEGSINVMNVSRLYRRYGEPETLRTARGVQSGMGATATPLTPYGERIINAVARRDTAEAIRLKNEAIKVARDMGKPDPERSVEQMILNRLPERRAFQGTISEAQYGELLGKMTPGERQYVARTSANLGAGLTALGIGLPRLQAPAARRGRRTGRSMLFAGRRRGLRPARLRRRRRRRIFA